MGCMVVKAYSGTGIRWYRHKGVQTWSCQGVRWHLNTGVYGTIKETWTPLGGLYEELRGQVGRLGLDF